ncbi:helix-turn-helix domain-containing protein [Streptomyces sp. NPDC001728]|uniref:helix-turn-helix domain-containing protein n=1 Tax=Streptomyces sp. NPDC001728 TaxID=3154396 RepID=UPI003330BA4F
MFDEGGYGSGASGGAHDRLAARMRAMKERSGLSYGRLADRTHYSRSSWERFLNGKQVPSRVAVEQLAAAAGEEKEPLLALLDEVLASERAAALADGPGSVQTTGPQSAGRAQGPGPAPRAAPAQSAAPAAAVTTSTTTTKTAVPAPVPPTQDPAEARPSRWAARKATRPAKAPAGSPEPGPWRRRAVAWLPAARALGYVTLGALLGAVISVLVLAPGNDPVGTVAGPSASATADGKKGAKSVPAAGTIKVGCSSDTCLRREPQAMDCQWDATTVRQTWLRGMQIELRYSAACQAVWGRIEGGTIGDSVTIKDKGGHELSSEIRVERDTYTRMLAVAADRPWQEVTICGKIPRFHEQECSPVGAVQP